MRKLINIAFPIGPLTTEFWGSRKKRILQKL
jgi:hypothetical protein